MEEQGMKNTHLSLEEQLQNGNSQAELGTHDDFLEQMLSSLKSPWDHHLLQDVESPEDGARPPPDNDHGAVAAAKSFLLHQHLLLSRRSDGHIMPSLPLTPHPQGGDGSVQPLFNGWTSQQQPFQAERGMGSGSLGGEGRPTVAVNVASSGQAPQRQRVRARRGQATDPHSIAERLRRERIAERMKALQELVPNGNKTDKASMLDEIIDYVKFLQLQVKVLSMSRLGGAGAVSPLVADPSSEGRRSGGGATSEATEQQVAKMMEEDMGSAMQYLQGKGLCLMPISLATAISTSTSTSSSASPNLSTLTTLPHHHSGEALAKHDANRRPTSN